MKRFFLIIFFLVGIQTQSLVAISPETPRQVAIILGVEVSLGPFLFDIFEWIDNYRYGKSRVNIRKKPEAWLCSVVGGVILGALSYYILNKYTPKNKYAWAMKIKKEAEVDLLVCENDINGFIERKSSCRHAVLSLYNTFKKLESAYKCILSACEDPKDLLFKQECENLAQELQSTISVVKKYSLVIIRSKQWLQECFPEIHENKSSFAGSVPFNLIDSYEWSISLLGGPMAKCRALGGSAYIPETWQDWPLEPSNKF